jgi:hypothetical protein
MKIAEFCKGSVCDFVQNVEGAWSLKCKCTDLFGFFLDFDLESFSVFVQPEECGLSRSEPEIGVREPMQCPIIANFTIGITPRGVADLSDRELRDVSGDDSIR